MLKGNPPKKCKDEMKKISGRDYAYRIEAESVESCRTSHKTAMEMFEDCITWLSKRPKLHQKICQN